MKKPEATAPSSTVASPTAVVIAPSADKVAGKDGTSRVVKLIVAMLIVLGLLTSVLTWRFWSYTNPKRGLTVSRATVDDTSVLPTTGQVAAPPPNVPARERKPPPGG